MPSSRTSTREPAARSNSGPGTLYEAIQRLEDGGLIAEAAGRDPGNGQEAQRRYYTLTERGWTRFAPKCDSSDSSSIRRAPTAAAQGPGVKIFRLLTRAYPAEFRRRYGGELEASFLAIRDEPCYAGALGRLRFWTFVITDLLRTGARLRWRQFSTRSRPSPPPHRSRTEMDTIFRTSGMRFASSRRRPGFAAIAVLSLGLAIGANSLIYGLVKGSCSGPSLIQIPIGSWPSASGFPESRTTGATSRCCRQPNTRTSRACAPSDAVAAFDLGNRNISGGDVPERVFTALLLDDLFPVIGMAPQLGRGFTPEELVPGGAPVAIISNRLWHTRFGGDPGIVGRSVRIGSQSTTVVGVMPPGLILIGTDLWMPWGGEVDAVPRNRRQFTVVARLRPGASLAAANAELATLAGRTDQSHRSQFKEYEGWSLTAAPWAVALLEDMRPAAFLLLGAVALVLVIACANLAHLFLARSTTRQRELAVVWRSVRGGGGSRVTCSPKRFWSRWPGRGRCRARRRRHAGRYSAASGPVADAGSARRDRHACAAVEPGA